MRPSPAQNIPVTSTTTSKTAFTGPCRLLGWAFRENATVGTAATFIIRDGVADTDPIVCPVELAGDSSKAQWFGPDGIQMANGVRVHVVAGEVQGAVWIA